MQENDQKRPLLKLIDSIAYFLAGNFIIDYSIVIETSSDISTWYVTNWLTFITGLVLILVGLIYLLSILPLSSTLIINVKRKLPKLHNWFIVLIYCFLFAITSTQVFAVVLSRIGIPSFPSWIFILCTLFFAVLLISILYASRKVFSTLEGLFYNTVAFGILALYILLTADFNYQRIEVFSISLSDGELQLGFVLLLLSILVLVFAISSKRDIQLEQ